MSGRMVQDSDDDDDLDDAPLTEAPLSRQGSGSHSPSEQGPDEDNTVDNMGHGRKRKNTAQSDEPQARASQAQKRVRTASVDLEDRGKTRESLPRRRTTEMPLDSKLATPSRVPQIPLYEPLQNKWLATPERADFQSHEPHVMFPTQSPTVMDSTSSYEKKLEALRRAEESGDNDVHPSALSISYAAATPNQFGMGNEFDQLGQEEQWGDEAPSTVNTEWITEAASLEETEKVNLVVDIKTEKAAVQTTDTEDSTPQRLKRTRSSNIMEHPASSQDELSGEHTPKGSNPPQDLYRPRPSRSRASKIEDYEEDYSAGLPMTTRRKAKRQSVDNDEQGDDQSRSSMASSSKRRTRKSLAEIHPEPPSAEDTKQTPSKEANVDEYEEEAIVAASSTRASAKQAQTTDADPVGEAAPPTRRGRGRPKKSGPESQISLRRPSETPDGDQQSPQKQETPLHDTSGSALAPLDANARLRSRPSADAAATPKRKRGGSGRRSAARAAAIVDSEDENDQLQLAEEEEEDEEDDKPSLTADHRSRDRRAAGGTTRGAAASRSVGQTPSRDVENSEAGENGEDAEPDKDFPVERGAKAGESNQRKAEKRQDLTGQAAEKVHEDGQANAESAVSPASVIKVGREGSTGDGSSDGKVPLRVGLSKRKRIPSLLKMVKRS